MVSLGTFASSLQSAFHIAESEATSRFLFQAPIPRDSSLGFLHARQPGACIDLLKRANLSRTAGQLTMVPNRRKQS